MCGEGEEGLHGAGGPVAPAPALVRRSRLRRHGQRQRHGAIVAPAEDEQLLSAGTGEREQVAPLE